MTHVEILERTYDGRIPAGALEHARALDEAERLDEAAEEARALRLLAIVEESRPPKAPKAARVEQMATVMVDRATVSGACTDLDLEAAGFSRAEIDALGPHARARASRVTADRSLRR
jgi:hypothetical protein